MYFSQIIPALIIGLLLTFGIGLMLMGESGTSNRLAAIRVRSNPHDRRRRPELHEEQDELPAGGALVILLSVLAGLLILLSLIRF